MEKVMILATPAEIAEGLRLFMECNPRPENKIDFQEDRLSKAKAAKLAGV